jgi:hypothetical protein
MRYFFGFLVAIGLIIFIIILIFGGGGKQKAIVQTTGRALESYANTSAEVRMTIDGPVNAAQDHQQVRITVNSNEVVYQQISGYNGDAVNSLTFNNTEDSYYTFLRALGYAGFQHGDTNKDLHDERGRCPLGSRYIFDMSQDGDSLEHFWATTCGKVQTYLGNLPGTVQLFQQQVPNYRALTDDLKVVVQ